jgi:hypothetical protein
LYFCDFIQITGATASNYSLLSWQHNGFGSLVNPQNIDPTYFPQPADGGNTVTFTLTATGQVHVASKKLSQQ